VVSTLAFIVVAAAFFLFRNVTETVPLPIDTPTPQESVGSQWFEVFFTDPEAPSAQSFRGGPDEKVAQAIDAARLSVDIAVYDFDLWSVRDALIHARQRGVLVRMVTDSDNLENEEVGELKDVGIQVLGDRHEGLMHHKFVVIDRLEVWGGSMNYTVNDAYKNNNNLVHIRSSRLAENYTTEFEEMFTDDRFGSASPANTPYPVLTIDDTSLQTYFSPDDSVSAHLVDIIESAQQSVVFLAFSFTSDDIADAMLDRARAGVTVSGVFEDTQVSSNTGDEYRRLRRAGLDVRLDGNPRNMHHKVIIIDDKIVITGSYNFSANAENLNDENLIVIYSPQIAAQYMSEFHKIFDQAQKGG
jgi:phosphatidylserine/phosphatidylglycerophosphate/cardiolipin synthase-like enzyme